ncbi:unnamed protein product [Durusdinium trenchii]|uniref:Geranylgeranyl transferase type II subunit beta n=1 Tax=Durusdinium trenchii TaxID=1381693 RepID=A0ABP0Q1R1_9DINO
MASKDDGFARVHLQFLDMFIASGFKSLRKMEELRGTSEGGLVGLGEKAKLLLGAAVAETSLLSALYWITCAYTLLGHVIEPEMRQQILDFAGRCRCRSTPGAFAPHPAHQADLLNTVSAVQVAVLLDKPGILGDLSEVSHYVRSLQLPDGSFANRSGSNEGDCRFTFAALCALKLLARLENNDRKESLDSVSAWLLRCQNLDGGFGCRPGECESHAGHTFCCLAALSLISQLHQLSHRGRGRLIRWLSGRQCESGGMNGRPGKKADACYTWWTLAAAELLAGSEIVSMFDLEALEEFVEHCMSAEGGVAPHPHDDPDPFHTFFGLAGLSLVEHAREGRRGLKKMEPTLVLPAQFS